jgi:lipoprotein-anchoring transpeptidase ErfK/SrfK
MADNLSTRLVVSARCHGLMFVAVAASAILAVATAPAGAESSSHLWLPSAHSNHAATEAAYDQHTHVGRGTQTPDHLKRAVVAYDTREAPGTIVIDTGNTYLYLVLGHGRAIRYGVGVGREGHDWSGVHNVSRKTEWPDWRPPPDMIARQPYLPRFVAGGETNPLGARAMYLGSSIYRIHGTNDPASIGKFVSSGCIRLTNEDVIDLFERVNLGARVVVLAKSRRQPLDAYAAMPARDVPPPVNRQPPLRSSVTSGLY